MAPAGPGAGKGTFQHPGVQCCTVQVQWADLLQLENMVGEGEAVLAFLYIGETSSRKEKHLKKIQIIVLAEKCTHLATHPSSLQPRVTSMKSRPTVSSPDPTSSLCPPAACVLTDRQRLTGDLSYVAGVTR